MKHPLAFLLLVSCSAADLVDRDRWLDQVGAECDPSKVPVVCQPLAEIAGGWCEPTFRECVIPCGDDCERVDGLCSTEGVCFGRR